MRPGSPPWTDDFRENPAGCRTRQWRPLVAGLPPHPFDLGRHPLDLRHAGELRAMPAAERQGQRAATATAHLPPDAGDAGEVMGMHPLGRPVGDDAESLPSKHIEL